VPTTQKSRKTVSKIAIIILFLIVEMNGFGQGTQSSEYLSQLNFQIKQYENSYKGLALARGQTYLVGDFTADKLRRAIGDFGLNMFGEEVPEFKFIFYHFQNDSLSTWLFNSGGDVDYMIKIRLLADSLVALEETLKFRLEIEKQIFASKRDFTDARAIKKYRLTSDQAINHLTNILLPDSVAARLADTKYLLILPCLNISSIPYGMLKPWKDERSVVDVMSYSFSHNLSEFFKTIETPGQGGKVINHIIVGNSTCVDSCTLN